MAIAQQDQAASALGLVSGMDFEPQMTRPGPRGQVNGEALRWTPDCGLSIDSQTLLQFRPSHVQFRLARATQ